MTTPMRYHPGTVSSEDAMKARAETTILIVDDSAAIRTLLEAQLDDLGFRAVTASNGREALEWLDRNRCDLVLSDVTMPVLGGIELRAHIQASEALRAIPVVLLTAASELSKLESLGLDANEYARKGTPPDELGALIERALERAAAHT
jgi:CheY-like chemotaxis protein